MIVAGLTGGIGSGKSAAADLFAKRGVPVIDADAISHELTAPGQPVVELIRKQWGDEVITASGELDRARLRHRVFSDPEQLRILESILHPAIRRRIQHEIDSLRAAGAPWCLVVVPLLFESGFDDLVDRVIVVDIPTALQIERVVARDHVSAKDAQRILERQMPREERASRADYLIDNSGPLEALEPRVAAIHQQLSADAQSGQGLL